MSQDPIGVVTTGRGKLQEWKTTQKQNLSRKSRGTLTVKWAGSRDKIFSSSGRGRTFFLTSLFIELIGLPTVVWHEPESGLTAPQSDAKNFAVKLLSIAIFRGLPWAVPVTIVWRRTLKCS